MTPIEAMKQALEALENIQVNGDVPGWCKFDTGDDAVKYHAAFSAGAKAITNLRTAIAEMEKADHIAIEGALENDSLYSPTEKAEPVAWWNNGDQWEFISGAEEPPPDFGQRIPLYTHPQTADCKAIADAIVGALVERAGILDLTDVDDEILHEIMYELTEIIRDGIAHQPAVKETT